jgi:alpha-galactosidase
VLAQIDRPRATVPPRLPISGLLPDQAYRVTLQAISEKIDSANRRFNNPIWQEGFTLSGKALARAGLGLPSLYAQTALAIAIDAVVETA